MTFRVLSVRLHHNPRCRADRAATQLQNVNGLMKEIKPTRFRAYLGVEMIEPRRTPP